MKGFYRKAHSIIHSSIATVRCMQECNLVWPRPVRVYPAVNRSSFPTPHKTQVGKLKQRYGVTDELVILNVARHGADKVLLVTSFLVLGATGLIPIWLVMLVVCRDLVIVGGAFYYNFEVEEVQPAPTLISKLNTLLQILLIILVTMHAGPFPLPLWWLETLQWAVLGTILGSGGHYVYVWSRMAAQKGWKE